MLTKAELSLLAKTRDKTVMVKHLMVETETKSLWGVERVEREALCQESSLLVRAKEPAKELLNDDEICCFSWFGRSFLWLAPCASTTILLVLDDDDDDDVGLLHQPQPPPTDTPRESFPLSPLARDEYADPRLNLRVSHVESFVECIDTSQAIYTS